VCVCVVVVFFFVCVCVCVCVFVFFFCVCVFVVVVVVLFCCCCFFCFLFCFCFVLFCFVLFFVFFFVRKLTEGKQNGGHHHDLKIENGQGLTALLLGCANHSHGPLFAVLLFTKLVIIPRLTMHNLFSSNVARVGNLQSVL